jgi:glutamyl-Q tRNA(Asp) synthetase
MIVTRFAPSPTGHLHLGHVHSALAGWHAARDAGGRFLLRIEDIDPQRCRPAFETALIEDLRWLGIDWDGPVRRQSEHVREHAAALARLADDGLAYPCFCSRRAVEAEIARAGGAPHGPEGPHYPGTCRHLSTGVRATRLADGTPHAWRLDSAAVAARAGPVWFDDAHAGRVTADPGLLGDVVIARRDVPTSYHLAVVVDDAAQGVTLVTRGEDLLAATHVHRLLQAALDLPVPAYAHHGLLRDAAGARLSKRDGALSVRALRAAGRSAAAVLAMAMDGVTGLPPENGNGPAAAARATSASVDEAGGR